MNSRALELIKKLELSEHPEGGFFKETCRSDLNVFSPTAESERSAVTEIYFLLCKGQVSRFHKVLHDEFWHFFEGAPLRLIDGDMESFEEVILDPANCQYQHCIRGGRWQAAESTGDYTLVGCTVAPGFDFADFSFLSEDESEIIQNDFAQYARFI
ncbi:cupin domain-containing protein [Lentisphaera profundi]|uniref:Cupin domain-containing protein n=1 Tax=Lentisphaera profundi TaxID=1658616 RepID=A0ABY7VZV6_9BACT|nr:cupin domain-containing protein [Lentisphaera profundi]WDE98819.1 cupin domain-containing protein [Lentisphaera profundi]